MKYYIISLLIAVLGMSVAIIIAKLMNVSTHEAATNCFLLYLVIRSIMKDIKEDKQ